MLDRDGDACTVDNHHRMVKAFREGKRSLPALIVLENDAKNFLVKGIPLVSKADL